MDTNTPIPVFSIISKSSSIYFGYPNAPDKKGPGTNSVEGFMNAFETLLIYIINSLEGTVIIELRDHLTTNSNNNAISSVIGGKVGLGTGLTGKNTISTSTVMTSLNRMASQFGGNPKLDNIYLKLFADNPSKNYDYIPLSSVLKPSSASVGRVPMNSLSSMVLPGSPSLRQPSFTQPGFVQQPSPNQGFTQPGFVQQPSPNQGFVQQQQPSQGFTQPGFMQPTSSQFTQPSFGKQPSQGFTQPGFVQQQQPSQGFTQSGPSFGQQPSQGFTQPTSQGVMQQQQPQSGFTQPGFGQQQPQSGFTQPGFGQQSGFVRPNLSNQPQMQPGQQQQQQMQPTGLSFNKQPSIQMPSSVPVPSSGSMQSYTPVPSSGSMQSYTPVPSSGSMQSYTPMPSTVPVPSSGSMQSYTPMPTTTPFPSFSTSARPQTSAPLYGQSVPQQQQQQQQQQQVQAQPTDLSKETYKTESIIRSMKDLTVGEASEVKRMVKEELSKLVKEKVDKNKDLLSRLNKMQGIKVEVKGDKIVVREGDSKITIKDDKISLSRPINNKVLSLLAKIEQIKEEMPKPTSPKGSLFSETFEPVTKKPTALFNPQQPVKQEQSQLLIQEQPKQEQPSTLFGIGSVSSPSIPSIPEVEEEKLMTEEEIEKGIEEGEYIMDENGHYIDESGNRINIGEQPEFEEVQEMIEEEGDQDQGE